MIYASLAEEKKLWKKGYRNIACLDEAGRGPLAGPVVAGAVMINLLKSDFNKLRDSKQKIIEKINILEATKLAMIKAAKDLETKHGHPRIDFLILDGKMELDLPIPQKSIIKADEKVFSCAAASIIAKVTRDRMMMEYHKKYPKYRFNLHKGYGTKLHYRMLNRYGPCQIHRKSYRL